MLTATASLLAVGALAGCATLLDPHGRFDRVGSACLNFALDPFDGPLIRVEGPPPLRVGQDGYAVGMIIERTCNGCAKGASAPLPHLGAACADSAVCEALVDKATGDIRVIAKASGQTTLVVRFDHPEHGALEARRFDVVVRE